MCVVQIFCVSWNECIFCAQQNSCYCQFKDAEILNSQCRRMEHDSFEELANESFDEYDDESTIIYETKPKSKVTNAATRMVNEVLLSRAKYNNSYASVSAHCKSLNSVPGAQIQIPTNKNRIKKEATSKYEYEIHIFCDSCDSLFRNGKLCDNGCKKTKKKGKSLHIHSNPATNHSYAGQAFRIDCTSCNSKAKGR